jgi:hypothetical protein
MSENGWAKIMKSCKSYQMMKSQMQKHVSSEGVGDESGLTTE